MKRCIISLLAGLFLCCGSVSAQKFSVSTNVLDYVCLGTMNADVSLFLSQRWSVVAGVKYNPFTFRAGNPSQQFQFRQRSCSLGMRMWPWHTASGWWFSSRIRWQEYNSGGVPSLQTREGDRFGLGLYAGYTHMISKHLNIEFGFGAWAGADKYRMFSCPSCGVELEAGTAGFILPDNLIIAFAYVF